MQEDNDAKRAVNTEKDSDWPCQLSDFNKIANAFHLLMRRETNKNTERSLEKHHKRRIPLFGDVSGLCSFCKAQICNQILSLINI